MDGNSLVHLANLLKQEDEQEEDELDESPYSVTPGAIGQKVVSHSFPSVAATNHSKDIWSTEEVSEGGQHDYNDAREEPEYDMLYKQTVGSEDLFLGVGNKTPLTSSCTHLTVKINLPNTLFRDIDLMITNKFLDCRTPKYRLGLHLPHSVDSDSSVAKWHEAKGVLEVALKLVREYDFVNQ